MREREGEKEGERVSEGEGVRERESEGGRGRERESERAESNPFFCLAESVRVRVQEDHQALSVLPRRQKKSKQTNQQKGQTRVGKELSAKFGTRVLSTRTFLGKKYGRISGENDRQAAFQLPREFYFNKPLFVGQNTETSTIIRNRNPNPP